MSFSPSTHISLAKLCACYTHSRFSKSLVVSVAISKTCVTTTLFFVDPGVEVNGKFYHDVLLSQQILPAIKSIVGDTFILDNPSAAHRARETIQLLQRETPILSFLILASN